jgi:hypothetical protein
MGRKQTGRAIFSRRVHRQPWEAHFKVTGQLGHALVRVLFCHSLAEGALC